jgi:D-tyrosyl-tRNA(Tyr) deacylase
MIAVIQRVSKAVVSVDGQTVGSCNKGLCVLLGVSEEDSQKDAEVLANKVINLRIFSDENDRMNLSLKDIDGEMLLVSNFTLLASYRKGNRPDYMKAAAPQMAEELYKYFGELCQREVKNIGYGVFGAHMELSITNDGPVTIVMDSKVLLASKKSS